jgi:hypothetical protein
MIYTFSISVSTKEIYNETKVCGALAVETLIGCDYVPIFTGCMTPILNDVSVNEETSIGIRAGGSYNILKVFE